MSSVIIFVAVAIPTMIAMFIRRRLPSRPTLGAVIVVVAVALGIVACVVLLGAYDARRRDRARDEMLAHLTDRICQEPAPPASDLDRVTLREVTCTRGTRSVRLDSRGSSINVQTNGDKALVYAMKLAPAATGKTYRLWMLGSSGAVLDQWELDNTGPRYVQSARLASATDVALSLETGPGATPTELVTQAKLIVPER